MKFIAFVIAFNFVAASSSATFSDQSSVHTSQAAQKLLMGKWKLKAYLVGPVDARETDPILELRSEFDNSSKIVLDTYLEFSGTKARSYNHIEGKILDNSTLFTKEEKRFLKDTPAKCIAGVERTIKFLDNQVIEAQVPETAYVASCNAPSLKQQTSPSPYAFVERYKFAVDKKTLVISWGDDSGFFSGNDQVVYTRVK